MPICRACGGSGSSKKIDLHPDPNRVDSDTGTVECFECGGSGQCSHCNGSGEEN